MTINKLKLYRQQKDGLTQAKLTLQASITEQHYQNLEYGKAEPKVSTARRLADGLGIETYEAFKDLFPLPGEESKYRT